MAQGNDLLKSLGETGVGAIGLGNIATPFDIKNNANQLLGQILQFRNSFAGEWRGWHNPAN